MWTVESGGSFYRVSDHKGNDVSQFADAGQAITFALTKSNRVRITAGTHTLLSQIMIPSNRTLEGDGIGRTILQLAAGTGDLLGVSADDAWIRNADWTNGNNNITLRDFEIDGNRTNRIRTRTTGDSNIQFNASSVSLVSDNIRIENVYSHSSNGQGIHLRYCTNSWVVNCKATDNGRNNTDLTWNGIYLLRCNDSFIVNCRADSQNDKSGIKTSVCNRVIVQGCIANNNPVDGFEGGDTGTSPPNNSDDVSFIGCEANSNSGQGFEWNVNGSTRIKLIGCTAKLNSLNGLVFNNIKYATVEGCVMMNNDQAAGNWEGIRITASSHFSIIGNQVGDDQGSHTQAIGIHVTGAACDYIIILGNDGTGNTSASVTVDGGNANGINANNK